MPNTASELTEHFTSGLIYKIEWIERLEVAPGAEVEVNQSPDGRVWVNVNGVCALRFPRGTKLVTSTKEAEA